ncbi:toxic anion resistance protein, partial [Bacillus mojavensis]|uniref:toxic anion resistance protein n=1 Tax=Bacillus mojavensis TaxID=72360 RepID=UPI00165AFDDB
AVKAEKEQVRLVDVLPEENKEKPIQLAGQIDHKNMQSIVLYGSQAQSKLLNFSHDMINHVQKKDVGEIGEILGELMKKLEQ